MLCILIVALLIGWLYMRHLASTGKMDPEIVKVIEDYDYSTRALPTWDSGISIVVEPNPSGGHERKAWITVQSFTMNDTIEIIQYAGCYGPEE